jgi:hypothetical protein
MILSPKTFKLKEFASREIKANIWIGQAIGYAWLYFRTLEQWSRVCLVSITKRYGLYGTGIGVPFPAGVRDLPVLYRIKALSGVRKFAYAMPQILDGRGPQQTIQSTAEIKNGEVVPPLLRTLS